jgi:hypothetical protein
MKKAPRVTLMMALAVFLLCCGFSNCFSLVMTKGKMPAEADAIAIRQDALDFMVRLREKPDNPGILPESITNLSPIRYELDDSGIFIEFKDFYLSDYGYYYPVEDRPPTAHFERPVWRVAAGVYRYELHR